ncbi:MAG TPA: hypothetical protein PLK77_06340 [Pyrinomonadaceae bacterium]|nr:hypothetical protein [Pyrinomonadaceae bacterium]
MRKRDREKIIKNIEVDIESKQGHPISVRPYDEDHKKLEEISSETGEKKASIVRRMIRFALNERQQNFAAGRCQEKLDWLVRTGRQQETINLAANDNLVEIREGVERIESGLENALELLRQANSLTTEIYSMSSMSISSLNLVFTKLIEYTSPETNDRKQSVVIASTAMAELIDHAVSDLKKCLLFHEHAVGDESAQRSYLESKIPILKLRIESLPKATNQKG